MKNVEIYIDKKPYQVEEGKNLLEACLSLGLDLPYFCWHPAMDSVGACRQCAILKYKDENDERGKLFMACMEKVVPGMRISLEQPKAKQFRAGIIEALMINHPHDCPVCDEGGECHLQDMTVMTGHNYRRYRFEKRTHNNQYLGPFIYHEMNRCIQCYRCVRFYNDYAGGKDFGVFAAHDDVYFGRSEPGVLENEFSGNLVEVCPTGVFTDNTLRQHYTRKWDLTNAPSVCHGCSVGCNILAGERYGTIRRTLTRYNGDVNGYFICDRGRFGYEYTNSENRFTTPFIRNGANLDPIVSSDALKRLKEKRGDGKVIWGIGSPRASLESNFMLRQLVGEDNFYAGISKREGLLIKKIIDGLKNGPVRTPSLKEVENFDTVVILGEDVTNTAPMLALSLRQTAKTKPKEDASFLNLPKWDDAAIREVVQGDTGPVYIVDSHATRLDDIATKKFHLAPSDIARFGHALAHKVNPKLADVTGWDAETEKRIEEIAEVLKNAKRPLIVSGTSYNNSAIVEAAFNLANALHEKNTETGIVFSVSEANSMGLSMLSSKFLDDALQRSENEAPETLFVMENNLFIRDQRSKIDAFLNRVDSLVVLDNLKNETTQRADLILPVGTFAESDGTLINNEGRAQRFYRVHAPDNAMQSSWAWLDCIRSEVSEPRILDAIADELIDVIPELDPIKNVAPRASERIGTQEIPRQPYRYTGRTSIHAHKDVNEPKPPIDSNSPMSFTMEGFRGVPPPENNAFYWAPGWNSVQAINKFQIEVGGKLKGGNPGIRLIDPTENSSPNYFTDIPDPFSAVDKQWLAVPIYHIFGTEELTAQSPAIAERAPEAYVSVGKQDAERLSIAKEGEKVILQFENKEIEIPVKFDHTLPPGLMGFPKGIQPFANVQFPFETNLIKSSNSHE